MSNSDKLKEGKIIIFTAPSGSGKTTVVRHVLNKFDFLDFSVSATTRKKRPHEKDGVDYYFMSEEEFKLKRRKRKFAEWQEVYNNQYYGTLKSEIERIWEADKHIVFDIEVKGATNIKKKYGDKALAVFIKVPSLEILIQRLKDRKTESESSLKKRIKRVKRELTYERAFDTVLVNDKLEDTLKEAEKIVEDFIFGK
jgi:guanylate kinase